MTGKVAGRWGVEGAWLGLAVTTAAAILMLGVAVSHRERPVAIAAMIVFGGAYISLTGVLILWARRVAPGTAGAATSILFIAFALGKQADRPCSDCSAGRSAHVVDRAGGVSLCGRRE